MERSQICLPIVCFILTSLYPLCLAQMDTGNPRCILLNNTTGLPSVCTQYYGLGDAYFRGSTLSGIQFAFQRITDRFQESDNEICVDLVMRYLCYYYFPLCNPDTGEIVAVCSNSCTLLTNNPDCLELRRIANEELEREQTISTGDSCMPTHRPYVDLPPVSNDCVSIEETVNGTFPLTCDEIPIDNVCLVQLPYSHFAPATNEGCNPTTGRLLPICPTSCFNVDVIISQCSSEFFRNNPAFPATNAFLDSFVCFEPQTYFNFPLQYIEAENASDCSAIVTSISFSTSTSTAVTVGTVTPTPTVSTGGGTGGAAMGTTWSLIFIALTNMITMVM